MNANPSHLPDATLASSSYGGRDVWPWVGLASYVASPIKTSWTLNMAPTP